MNAPGVQLRRLRVEDLEAVLALWARAGIMVTLSDRIEELERVLERNPGTCLAAVDAAGELAGAALGTFDGRRANLWHLAVEPHRQGEGIGRLLMAALEERWREDAVVKITFTVESDNAAALAFYERLGYRGRDDIMCVSKILRED